MSNKQTKVISVLNMKGGVGKTTLTTNLATELAARNKKVLVLDVDPQFNTTQTLFKFATDNLTDYHKIQKRHRTISGIVQNSDTLSGVVQENDDLVLSESVRPSEVAKSNPFIFTLTLQLPEVPTLSSASASKQKVSMDIIPGDLKLIVDVNTSSADKLSAFFYDTGLIGEKYDYILIDCPPTWSQLTSIALSNSTHYLIPTNLDEFSTMGISILTEQLATKNSSMRGSLKCLGIVYMFLNTTTSPTGITRKQIPYKSSLEHYVKHTMVERLDNPVHIFQTLFHKDNFFVTSSTIYRSLGKTPYERRKYSAFAELASNLTDEILVQLDQTKEVK